MELYIVIAIVLLALLSFANGANDVSKAIATLAGAKVTSMRKAVMWGTTWTLAGSMSGLYLGSAIIKNITQNIYTSQPEFIFPMALAIGIAPALWVILATWKKWPVSTTHAVVGGLLGAGVTALGISGIAWNNTLLKIGLPLLVSPLLAIGMSYTLSPILQKALVYLQRVRFCLLPTPKLAFATINATASQEQGCVVCDCDSTQAMMNHKIAISVDHLHWLTSGMLSFSRGLNDTPKLIAVILPFLLAGDMAQDSMYAIFWVSGISMAAGGLLVGSRITEILGFKVTKLNHTQGFSANAVATLIVLFASKLGMPVSTTHVSSCSIMGLGLSEGIGLNKSTIVSMLFAWIITVPSAAFFAFTIYHIAGII